METSPGRKGPPYSVQDIDRLKELALSLVDRELAKEFSCSIRTIRNTRKRFGIPAAKPRKGAA